MGKLTKAQISGLRHIAASTVHGPAPGWNASVWIEGVCDGEDLDALFSLGLISASKAAPPYYEDLDEEAGSITCDHLYSVTEKGRKAMERENE